MSFLAGFIVGLLCGILVGILFAKPTPKECEILLEAAEKENLCSGKGGE